MHDEIQIKNLLREKAKPYDFEGVLISFENGGYVHVYVQVKGDNKDHIKEFIDETYYAITDGEVIFPRRLPEYETVKDFEANEIQYGGGYRFSVKALKEGE